MVMCVLGWLSFLLDGFSFQYSVDFMDSWEEEIDSCWDFAGWDYGWIRLKVVVVDYLQIQIIFSWLSVSSSVSYS